MPSGYSHQMSDTRHTLFQAVVDEPEAEAPRRAFAAWLDAQGDPQGEFIRLQLDAARERSRFGYSEDHARLSKAAKAILARHGNDWSQAVDRIASDPRFHSGFVEGVTIDARQFLAHAAELYRVAPVRHVVLTGARDVIDELAASPHLDRLASLGLDRNQLGDEDVRAIVASPHLGRLGQLDISFNDVGVAGLEALCASKNLPRLAHVNFEGNRVKAPVEEFGEDWTGPIIWRSFPEYGQQLEARYGPQPWLHAPSMLADYPPMEADF
jgi:uncharacterized protein (TIGR02996 family)